MATLRKLVSDVRSMHKLISTDGLVTDRTIASEIRNNTLLLVKRETNLRRLWSTDTLFTTIPCLELEQVSITECCNFIDDCTIARTKLKLPRISEGNYQYLIQGVWSINAMGGLGKRFKETSINRYSNLLKLPIIKKESYYWIVNDYLYLTDPLVQNVRISALFEDELPPEVRYSGKCSEGVTDGDWCMNPLDREYACPGYLEKQVLELTSQKLLSTYFRIADDKTQNNNDEQIAAPQFRTNQTNPNG